MCASLVRTICKCVLVWCARFANVCWFGAHDFQMCASLVRTICKCVLVWCVRFSNVCWLGAHDLQMCAGFVRTIYKCVLVWCARFTNVWWFGAHDLQMCAGLVRTIYKCVQRIYLSLNLWFIIVCRRSSDLGGCSLRMFADDTAIAERITWYYNFC